jgi:hypothetical protein
VTETHQSTRRTIEPGADLLGNPAGWGPPMPQAVVYLQVYALVLMIVPSDNVIDAIGGSAHLAGLIGLGGFVWWLASALFRIHDPRQYPSPIRLSFLVLWIASLASYLAMALVKPELIEVNGADRWIMEIACWTGVGLIAMEGLNSLADFKRVLRALAIGGAICGGIAAIQFWLNLDLAQYLRSIPGFTRNYDYGGISDRDSLSRVAGTAIHPIELGVVASVLMPISVCSAMLERGRSTLSRWLPVMLVAVAIPASVSRSAILTVAISMGIYVICMRPLPRAVALLIAPLTAAAVFMSAPGLIGTMREYIFAGSNDSSIAARQSDYPLVERLVAQHPWFGTGGGTYLPTDPFDILDNQYLKMMIELGLVGTVAVTIGYFIFPAVLAFVARKRARTDELRDLGAALGSAGTVAILCAATFDSLTFPQFAGLQALIVGMIGAYWRLIRCAEREPRGALTGTGPETDVTPPTNARATASPTTTRVRPTDSEAR